MRQMEERPSSSMVARMCVTLLMALRLSMGMWRRMDSMSWQASRRASLNTTSEKRYWRRRELVWTLAWAPDSWT